MFAKMIPAALIAMTVATGASAGGGMPTFSDILPTIKFPAPGQETTLSTRGSAEK